MPSDAQLPMEERPQSSKFGFANRLWVRFIVPLIGVVSFLWLSFRLSASGPASHLNSLSDRLRLVGPSLVCSAVSIFFFLWLVFAIRNREPSWAAAISSLGMIEPAGRRKRWDWLAYLSSVACVVAGAIDLSTSMKTVWPSFAKQLHPFAYILWSVLFFFTVDPVWERKTRQPLSADAGESATGQAMAAGRKD